jgi:hypothetical protein
MIWILVGHFVVGLIIYALLLQDNFKQYGIVTLSDLVAHFGMLLGGYLSALIVLFVFLSDYVVSFPIFKKKG